jgi:hypothetical protein
LREAILAANASPDADQIVFDIPGTGPHTIQPGSRLPTIVDPIVIDGYTQPGASANTNPPELGSNAVIQVEVNGDLAGCASGFWIETENSVVRGLAVTGFSIVGRECGAGFLVRGSGNNSIEGNFIGIDPSGSLERPNHMGITLVSPRNTVGGAEPGARNVISGNNEYGIWVANANESRVIGNLIGTDASGEVAVPNTVGILVRLAYGNVFGGVTASERNVISGNGQDGLAILDYGSTENHIEGNYIGTDVSGTKALGNGTDGFANGAGIAMGGHGNVIGGDTKDAGNLVAHNQCSGMYVNDDDNVIANNTFHHNGWRGCATGAIQIGHSGWNIVALRNLVTSNSIFMNEGLGIDLGTDGVTENDPGDNDTGSTEQQNFPVLSNAVAENVVTIVGTLDSKPNGQYTLEFFGNTECDPSGYGEGELLLGTDNVTTNALGNVAFTVVLPRPVHVGEFATATATDEENNTSEFSACIPIEVLPTFLPVVIDVKPGNVANVINPRSRGRFWVAVLSAEGFDALRVDPASVRLGTGGASPDKYRVRDSNYDGVADLLVRFRTPKVGIVCGDTSVELTGQTYDGVEIVGEDDVRTVGCKKPKPKNKGKKK